MARPVHSPAAIMHLALHFFPPIEVMRMTITDAGRLALAG
jgi:hypothetical protein